MNKHQFGNRSGEGCYVGAEFGEDAEIFGAPVITYSKILGGKIFGGPTLFGANIITNAIIADECEIIESLIGGQAVVCDKAKVIQSIISDNARVTENAGVFYTHMHENAMVCGTGIAKGTEEAPLKLTGYDYIDRGLWTRPPLTFVASSGFVISENIDNLVTVSCTTNTIAKWLGGAGRRYGKQVGMTEEQIDEVQGYVETVRDFKEGIRENEKA